MQKCRDLTFTANVDLGHRSLSLEPTFMLQSFMFMYVFIIWFGEEASPRTRAKLLFSVITLCYANRGDAT